MTLHRWSGLALLGWVGALAIACGDDDEPETGSDTGGTSSGGRGTGGAVTGNAGTSDDGGEAGAGGSNSTGGSATGGVPFPIGGRAPAGAHIPDVPLEQTGEVFAGDPVEGFEVTASHYYVVGTDHVWLGVVVNNGDSSACSLAVSLSLEAADGTPVRFLGAVVAPMYRLEGLTPRQYCLAPGQIGVAIAEPVEAAPQLYPEDVTAASYGISGQVPGDVIPADWVRLGNAAIENQGLKSRVSGDIEKLSSAAVTGITAVVFPRNADGAPLTHYRVRDPRTGAPAGSTWHFQTPFYEGNFEDAAVFYEHGTPGGP